MVEETPSAAAAIAVDAEEVVAFARALVRAPSENPGGSEHEAVRVAGDLLAGLGFRTRTVHSPQGRPNLVATLGDGSRPKLVWNGHLDVVPAGDPGGWPHPPFEAVVDGGRLHGRGACDMKGSVAAAIAAAAALLRAGVEPAATLELHLVADEEHMGLHGTKVLMEQGLLEADACIVGEPSGLALGLAQRGGAWIRAVARGVAAHGSRPELGVNAITGMARFLLRLPEALPERSHPLLGAPTVNVALIEGGRAPNMVPDECEADIDRRTLPRDTPESVLTPFERVAMRLREEDPSARVSVEIRDWTEASEVRREEPIVDVLRRAAAAELGAEPPEIGFSGITDARFYVNGAGVPAVVFGPGDLALAHTSDEHVEVSDLITAARIYARVFAGFGSVG